MANSSDNSIRSILSIAVIAVAVLLVISIVAGVIVMAVNGVFDNLFDKNDTTQNDDGGGSKPSKKPSAETEDNGLSLPNNLKLPVQSANQNYISTNASSYTSIDGISSAAAILVKMDGNVALAGKSEDTVIHPASMSKLMTLIVACENMPTTNALLTVEQWMEDYRITEGGYGVGLKVGQQISVEDALYLIIYYSDTNACLMVAKHVAGSEQEFVKLMNKKAADMKLSKTHFANCTGNYDEVTNGDGKTANDHTRTTCREMAAIMNCAMNNTAAKKIIMSTHKSISVYRNNTRVPDEDLSPYAQWLVNEGRFAGDPVIEGTNGGMKVIAGKTGNEDIPSNCFVTVAKDTKTGEQYICVVVGKIDNSQTKISPKTSTSDTEKIYANYAYNK